MNTKILKIVLVGLMAGLCYISFMFLQIKIPTPGGFTSFHLGNTFCVLAALLLGGDYLVVLQVLLVWELQICWIRLM